MNVEKQLWAEKMRLQLLTLPLGGSYGALGTTLQAGDCLRTVAAVAARAAALYFVMAERLRRRFAGFRTVERAEFLALVWT